MKSFAYLLTVAVAFGAGVITPNVVRTQRSPGAAFATGGPYRDGLYLGRLAAAAGKPAHASVGRWSMAADRQAFSAGYDRGYSD